MKTKKRWNVLVFYEGERIGYRNVSTAISRMIGIWVDTKYENGQFIGSRHYFIH